MKFIKTNLMILILIITLFFVAYTFKKQITIFRHFVCSFRNWQESLSIEIRCHYWLVLSEGDFDNYNRFFYWVCADSVVWR